MSAGRDKGAEAQVRQQNAELLAQQRQLLDQSRERTARMDALQDPAIKYAIGLASGDPEKIAWASSVPIGNITKGFRAAKENIYDTVPAGAAREFALAGAERAKNENISTGLNQSFFESLNTLMQAGGAQGNFGLQQLGAGFRAGDSAMAGNQSLMQAEAQRKQAQMGFLGSLAGVAGGAVGGMMGGGSRASSSGGGTLYSGIPSLGRNVG